MRFFHISDLHIGLRLLNRDMQPDQIHILDQIAEYVKKEQPDAVVIAGDIYDKAVPSAEAVGIFDRFVNALNTAAPDAEILVISGNHDSAARVNISGMCSADIISTWSASRRCCLTSISKK